MAAGLSTLSIPRLDPTGDHITEGGSGVGSF